MLWNNRVYNMCPLYTHVTPILWCIGPCNLFGRVWSMLSYNTNWTLSQTINAHAHIHVVHALWKQHFINKTNNIIRNIHTWAWVRVTCMQIYRKSITHVYTYKTRQSEQFMYISIHSTSVGSLSILDPPGLLGRYTMDTIVLVLILFKFSMYSWAHVSILN